MFASKSLALVTHFWKADGSFPREMAFSRNYFTSPRSILFAREIAPQTLPPPWTIGYSPPSSIFKKAFAICISRISHLSLSSLLLTRVKAARSPRPKSKIPTTTSKLRRKYLFRPDLPRAVSHTSKPKPLPEAKFSLFPNLPFELREMIWSFALPDRQVVTIKHNGY